MKVKSIAIVAGGTLSTKLLSEIKNASYIVGVDYGAKWLLSQNVIPQEAIGDFDSVTKDELFEIEDRINIVTRYPKEKDWTDTELAIKKAISLKPQEIEIYGATGTRLDHTISVCMILEKYINDAFTISLVDEHNSIEVVTTKKTLQRTKTYTYVSLLPLTSVCNVSLSGFLYPLHTYALKRNQSLGISNELIEKHGIITVHKGKVLLIRSHD